MFFFKKKANSETSEEKFKKLAKEQITKILLSGRCSPKDENNISQAIKESGYKWDVNEHLYVQKSLWQHDNNKPFNLPELSIEMDDGTICYHSCAALWYIKEQDPNQVNMGVYENEGSAYESYGHLFVTDATLIFVGHPRSIEIEKFHIKSLRLEEKKPKTDKNILSLTDISENIYRFSIDKFQAEYLILLLTKLGYQ